MSGSQFQLANRIVDLAKIFAELNDEDRLLLATILETAVSLVKAAQFGSIDPDLTMAELLKTEAGHQSAPGGHA